MLNHKPKVQNVECLTSCRPSKLDESGRNVPSVSITTTLQESKQMTRTIVLDEHTLGVIYPNGLQILRASVLRGSPILGDPLSAMGVIAFDPVLMADRFRPATEQDFDDYGVAFHPDYLKPLVP